MSVPTLSTSKNIVDRLWRGQNPYAGFPHRRFRADSHGWNSHHVFLSQTIETMRPKLVIEVGVWKGGSTIHMAKTMRSLDLDAAVIAVDTWLGSWEHWEQDEWFPDLLPTFGYPGLYYTFLTNVVEQAVQDYVVPLPLDSANAAFVIGRKGVLAQVIHVDAGHDFEAVISDLRRWWPLLEPGGSMIVDDYDANGKVWPSVREATDEFLKGTAHEAFEAVPYKCRFQKPVHSD